MRAFWSTLLVLAVLAPTANAAFLLPSHEYSGTAPYLRFEGGEATSLLSGRFDLTATGDSATHGFLNLTSAAQISGIEKFCAFDLPLGCTTGTFTLTVPIGASYGFRTPGTTQVTVDAPTAVGAFVDLPPANTLNQLGLTRSFIGLMEEGSATVELPAVPTTLLPNENDAIAMKAVLDGQLSVASGGSTVYTFDAADDGILMQGANMVVTPMEVEMVVVAVNGGATSDWGGAGGDPLSIQEAIAKLNTVLGAVGAEGVPSPDLGPANDVVGALFNGAYLAIPTADGGISLANMTLVRFSDFTAVPTSTGVQLEGQGVLVVEAGQVSGAQPLVGVGFVKVPWWTIVLWALAIVVFIVRLSLKPPKEHPVWDKYNWIGRVAGFVAHALVFLMWDGEVKALVGTSLLSGPTGAALILAASLQIGFLFLVNFLAQRPLAILIKNAVRLGRQGHFMGLGWPVAVLVGYFIAASALLSYLQIALDMMAK